MENSEKYNILWGRIIDKEIKSIKDLLFNLQDIFIVNQTLIKILMNIHNRNIYLNESIRLCYIFYKVSFSILINSYIIWIYLNASLDSKSVKLKVYFSNF